MKATKEGLRQAVAELRTMAVESTKSTVQGEPAIELKKAMASALRRKVAQVVSLAHLLSAGADTIKTMIGAATIKATGDVLKVRLSEANKVRKLHPRFDELAEMWASGEDAAFEEDTGYTVGQALKDVQKPRDPIGQIEKAVSVALAAGEDAETITEKVEVAIRQWQVEQDFLAEAGENEAKAA